MDEIEKFYALFNSWRRTFGLTIQTKGSIWTGTSLRILDKHGRVIVDRHLSPEDVNDDIEREEIRQAVYARARGDLTMWLGWMLDKYNFKIRSI